MAEWTTADAAGIDRLLALDPTGVRPAEGAPARAAVSKQRARQLRDLPDWTLVRMFSLSRNEKSCMHLCKDFYPFAREAA
jgi:hypothetical protein